MARNPDQTRIAPSQRSRTYPLSFKANRMAMVAKVRPTRRKCIAASDFRLPHAGMTRATAM